jgi:hypothetical protein
MPRKEHAPRRLVVEGREYWWTLRHTHRRPAGGPAVDCRETLTLTHRPGPRAVSRLRIVFAEGPGRFVPGGAYSGSGDVGFVHGAHLNLHEPGAVRALLEAASGGDRQPDEPGETVVDGWTLLERAAALRERAAAARREQGAGPRPA